MQTLDHDSGRRRTAIIVSGMHRSGISAITHVVSLLGVALPNQRIEEARRGESDVWEEHAVVDMNARVLDRFGSWELGWDSIDPQRLLRLTRVAERTRRLIRDEFAGADLIVLGDPRSCRLLPLWTHALEREGFRCVHVIALRHPAAVANSLARRDGLSPTAATLSWLAHSLDAERHTRAQPRVVVSFENLIRDWRYQAERIGQALALEWPQSLDDVADAVGEFIDPDLVHEPPTSARLGPVAAITPVYNVLKRRSEDKGRPDEASILDSWRMLLEPVRGVHSGAARISIERDELIADLETRERPVGMLGSGKVWGPIQSQGYNVEADAAWAWLRRERGHYRKARRAEAEITRLGRSLSELERSWRFLRRVKRRLGRRRPLSAQVPK